MEEEIQNELQELKNLQETGETLDDAQQSRLSILSTIDELEKTNAQKSKDLESALAQKEHFRKKSEEKEEKPKPQKELETPKELELSTADVIAITRAEIHEDDIQQVQDYAKFKGISVKDALKDGVLKTILADNEEKRKVAEATNTKITRRTPQKLSELEVYEKAEKGELPDDPADLARARTAKQRAEAKN